MVWEEISPKGPPVIGLVPRLLLLGGEGVKPLRGEVQGWSYGRWDVPLTFYCYYKGSHKGVSSIYTMYVKHIPVHTPTALFLLANPDGCFYNFASKRV